MEFKKRVAVRWESPEEWELETRAFNWNDVWPETDTRDLVGELWYQYCVAKQIEPLIDELKEALKMRHDGNGLVIIADIAANLVAENDAIYYNA